ncbi:flagellar protein FlaG [Vibrio maerlii]|uniref:flagellar protein FlaG n=1 Tax=Vibrio maerlii TaxID=2231648 RepID=UPI000E3B8FB4|nr:flagellar protein FlaG [Vibrio maerlii]
MDISSVSNTSYRSNDYGLEHQRIDSHPKQKQPLKLDSTQTKVHIDQTAKLINQVLPEFSEHLSAKVVNQGGRTFIEIRNSANDVVIKRISDAEIAEFVESRKVGAGSLLDQYV